MPDYGRPLRFGVFPTPAAADLPLLLRTAQQAEALGLDLMGIQDHPYQRRFLDTWTLLAFLAARTTSLRFFTDVANLPLRPPAMLAKAAASLDLLSGGRFDLGLGAGAAWDAIRAMGGPVRSPADAVAALEEAITVIRLAWSQERAVSFDGRFYSLKGYHPGPAPSRPIGLWVGGYGPRMLALIGRLADGWVPSLAYLKLERVPEQNARLDAAAQAAGRDPAALRRILNLWGTITPRATGEMLTGPASQWVDTLTLLAVEHGFDSFIFGGDPDDQLPRFAHEVVPAVRERVAQARGQA